MTKLPVPKSSSSAPAKQSPLQMYLREIAKYPLLEPEEEYDLAVRHVNEDDREAAHRLVTSNLRLVVKIANDYRQAQINLLDLIQEGNYGLMQAVKKFNPYKGVRLSSYAAWWIKAYILKYIMENRSQVKIGTTEAQRKLYYNLEKARRQLLAEFDEVDTKMLAETLNVREQDVIDMQMRLQAPDVSMDAPVGAEDQTTTTRGDLIPAEIESIEDLLGNSEILALFTDYLAEFRESLEGRDLEIFDARLMTDSPLTLQEIGDRYGVSRERARQIESRIVGKLKSFVEDKGKINRDVIIDT